MPHLTTDSSRLFYRWDGPENGRVLILAHALGANHTMWDSNMPALSARFRVLRYDSRGHGASDIGQGPCDIDRLGRDVLELIDALELDAVDFCGISMGAMAGMWLAAHAGERVRRLVLANTSAHFNKPEALNARIAAVRWGGMAGVAETMLERWSRPVFRSADPVADDRLRQMLLGTPADGYIAACRAVRDVDQRHLLGRIAVPTLVIAGKHDPATPPEHSYYLRDHIRGARMVELEAAHIANIEAAATFDAALIDFFEDTSGSQ